MTDDHQSPDRLPRPGEPLDAEVPLSTRLRRSLVGEPKDLRQKGLFHALSLMPFLAWVGLGADGLSSSAYGPEEAFKTLGQHTYLAVAVAAAMMLTVVVISAAYSRIIEAFPHGGGGYVVATKLLGPRAGLLSGAALLVDYVLTITVSIAAAGDALFSFLPLSWHHWKLPFDIAAILFLTLLNVRGVKESVVALTPIFLVFLATHAVVLLGGVVEATPRLGAIAADTGQGFSAGLSTLGLLGLLKLFVHSYSLGGGTYTGLEAVSNGLPIMREPRVQTAKRTMFYMAASLSVTAGGLLLCYLVFRVSPVEGKTLNAVLVEQFAGGSGWGRLFAVVTLVSEGALLIVGAQAGFLDGPRVMANMAIDSWLPHRLSALSDRLTTQNGILLMGAASLAALLYTGGAVSHLVVMYSINVFLTFSISMFGMLRHERSHRLLFGVGFLLCSTILAVTVSEKFLEGGWVTLVVTLGLVAVCVGIRAHYQNVAVRLAALDAALADLPQDDAVTTASPDPQTPTAVVLVGGFSGVGLHTLLNLWRAFPGHYKGVVFVSAGVIDSGGFKGEGEIEALRARTDEALQQYVGLARRMGIPADQRSAVGTDAVETVEQLCLDLSRQYPKAAFFAGQVIFHRERWYDRLLHNQTAFAIQKRLQWAGMTMVILPVRIR